MPPRRSERDSDPETGFPPSTSPEPGAQPALPPEVAARLTEIGDRLTDLHDAPIEDLAQVFPLVYDELRDLAQKRIQQLPAGDTLQPTALVHEAYLRVHGRDDWWKGRRHFFFVASRAMRDILVEAVRRRAAQKRGGGWRRETLSELGWSTPLDLGQIIDLDEALEKLESTYPEHYSIVLMRFFGGLSIEEIADLDKASAPTVKRRWRFARARLLRFLDENHD